MITFIPVATQKKVPTLKDVEENQFFINCAERLCQKLSASQYVAITNEFGMPCCEVFHTSEYNTIKKVLAKIEKIQFN